jgi:protoheme IX farnesyltransferase
VTTVDPRPNVAVDGVPVESSPVDATAADDVRGAHRGAGRGRRGRVGAYVALTKPRIIELLLITTVPTMIVAADGLPDLRVLVCTLVGGTLAAAGANAFNSYIDRDIDRVMHRTSRRPLVTGEVGTRGALALASALSVASVLWLALTVNGASAALAAAAIGFYVVIYTLVLKRRTAQNIVWGGAAGCMPVLIGWSAVTGGLDWPALVLFLIIFFWTPPHYWPLSIRYRDDYAAAGVPMLPVVANPTQVAKQIVLYSWAMVATSVALWPVAGMSAVYGAAAVLLGAAFLFGAHRLHAATSRDGVDDPARAMRLFHGSITYLTLLFAAIAIDPFLPF